MCWLLAQDMHVRQGGSERLVINSSFEPVSERHGYGRAKSLVPTRRRGPDKGHVTQKRLIGTPRQHVHRDCLLEHVLLDNPINVHAELPRKSSACAWTATAYLPPVRSR